MAPRNAAAILALLLCLSAAAPGRVAARKLLTSNAANEPPLSALRVKIRGCFTNPVLLFTIADHIAAVDNYAAASGRQRVTYAGIVSNLTAELGSFDMLITYTSLCNVPSYNREVFSVEEQAAVETALATGTLKKLMAWHSWNYAGANSTLPGISGVGCTADSGVVSISANKALYDSVGPNPASSGEAIKGQPASHGFCPASRVLGLNNTVAHAWDRFDSTRITAFSHCYQGRGAIFYSQIPMAAYLTGTRGAQLQFARLTEFHANAISVFSNDISCACPPTAKPVVTVSGVPASICEDASSVLLSFKATSSLGGSISIGTITGASCTVANTTVDSGALFTVNCTKGAGWPASPFNVTVAATAGSAGCLGSASGVASVTVTPKPVVTVSGVPASICEDASSVLLSFKATSSLGGSISIGTITGASCAVANTAVDSGALFTVNCTKGAGWPASPFNVTVAATAGSAGCLGSASGVASVTVTRPADVVLSDTWLPPNNKMFDVSLTSVPLQDPALPGNVTVSSVEFFDVLKGRRPTFPLAVISPNPSMVSLRAQRNGAGSGRLYRIKYTAANAAGSCGGVAFVCVPHDASAFNPLVNATTSADLAAGGVTAPPGEAPKVTCPIPSSIEEAQWMPTTAR